MARVGGLMAGAVVAVVVRRCPAARCDRLGAARLRLSGPFMGALMESVCDGSAVKGSLTFKSNHPRGISKDRCSYRLVGTRAVGR